MSLNFCDLLVLGSDLSGLMAATLLAKRGMNVLIFDDEAEDLPQPNLAVGIGSQSFKSLLGKLMIPDSKLQGVRENSVITQVIFPKHRLDLFANRSLYLKEIGREFPEHRSIAEDFLSEIDKMREACLDDFLAFFPILNANDKKNFIKWFQSFPDQKVAELWEKLPAVIQALFKAQVKFISRGPLMDPPFVQLMLFLPPEHQATYSMRGGIRELKKLFFDRIDYFGGMVHPYKDDTFEFVKKGKELKGLKLSRYNFPTHYRYLIGNQDVQYVYKALPSSFLGGIFDSTKKKIEGLEVAEMRGLLRYQAVKNSLPSPLKENAIFIQNPEAPLEGSNYFEMNISPFIKNDEPPYDTALTISYLLNGANEPTDADVAKVMEEIEIIIRKFLPFCNNHLRRIFPSPQVPQKENPELFSEQPVVSPTVYLKKNVSYAPSFFLPNLETSYKNLLLLGPNVLEWLGLEGKLLSALKAVETFWAHELKVKNS